jgi:transcriptional regulator with GAF, ATPase, and Fis domain
MRIPVVWRHHVHGDSVVLDGVIDVLARAGIQSTTVPGPLTGPGLVFFTRPDTQLFEWLHAVSRGGVERVLLVSLDDEPVSAPLAWRLLLAGASDVIPWRQHRNPAAEIAARIERWAAVDALVDAPVVRDNLVGRSPAWVATLRRLVEVARFSDASVLILGETGTGKELAARLIHTLDARSSRKDLVVQDCAAIVPQLSGSEFFGHERGAFTDAVSARDGCFALANGGTLFLDEISELPLSLQAELLRAVQERTFKRVGGNTWKTSEFRLLCASNRDLLHDIAQHAFRADLYYRLASVVIRLPPLRDRTEDIIPLVQTFLAQLHPGREASEFEIDDAVRDYLLTRVYAGNVRDLRQLVQRIDARHVGPGPITVGDIPSDERPSPEDEPPDWRDAAFEAAIRRAVARGVGLRDIGHAATEVAIDIAVGAEGSLQRAARQLRVTDRALQLRRAARRSVQ